MKKLSFILLLLLLSSCALNINEKKLDNSQETSLIEKSGAESSNKVPAAKSIIKDKKNENQSKTSSTLPTINEVITNLNGKTLVDLAKEMKDASESKSSEDQIVKDMEQLAFFEDCLKKGKVNISDFSQNYISESPIFFNTLDKESFSKNMAIALALDKYSSCLLANYNKVKARLARFYYYQNLAQSLAASFFMRSVLTGYLANSDSWCSSVEGEIAVKAMCKNLDEEKITDILINYYKITGHLIKNEQGMDISRDNNQLRVFIKNKIHTISKSIQTNQEKENLAGQELPELLLSGDFGISLHGIIEPIDELFIGNN